MNRRISLFFLLFCILTAVGQTGPIGFVNVDDGHSGIYGGALGEVVRVKTKQDLQRYASAAQPYIIIVEGRLEGQGLNRSKETIEVGSDKTIVGVKGAELAGIGLNISGKQNIIIRNLIIHHADPDGIAARNSHHIWVDHCEVYSQDEPDKEDWDGLVDLTNGSSYLTVSYCYFHDHHKACLLNSGTMHFEDNGKNRATYHHNAFARIDQRCPRIGYGLGHVFSNRYESIGSYAIGVHTQAQVLSENNWFGSGVSHPFENMYATSLDDASCGFIADRGSHFTTAPSTAFRYATTGTDFNPDDWYASDFAKDDAATVATIYPGKVGQVEGIEHEPILWPGNGAIDVAADARPFFSPIEGMTSAEVFLGTSPESLAQTDLSTLQLKASTTYYWQVKAYTATTSYTSPLYRFTTAAPKATRPTPADGETMAQLRSAVKAEAKTEPMALSWRPAFGAHSYNVYLATSPSLLDNSPAGSTESLSLNPGTLLYGPTYYWRVDAVMTDGSTVKGDVWTFSAPARKMTVGRTEMEHLARSAYAYLEREDGAWFKASNDSVTVGEAGPGAITGVWDGPDGVYTLSVDFYDEKAGQAWMGLSVNDALVDSWRGSKVYGMKTHKISKDIALRQGDQIRVDFYTQSKMRCRIDCIDAVANPSGITRPLTADDLEAAAAKGRVYDLQGRRVAPAGLKQGVYIVDNRKVVVGK